MHILTNSQPIDLGKPLGVLEPGDWLMNDQNAFEIAVRAPRGSTKIKDHGWLAWLSQEEDAPDLVMRSGAIGDLLMLSPVLAERKAHLSCFPHHFPIFEGTDQKVMPYPLALPDVNRYRNIISLENTMEMDSKHHAADVFAKALGVPTPLKSYKPIYHVTDDEKTAALKWIFLNRPNVAIQPRASIPNRDYPAQSWLQVIMGLEKRGWGVLILGKKGQIPPFPPEVNSPFIRNLAEENLSLRESVAVLSQCNAFAGVDSSFNHFAAALDIPSVSLFGPFDWQTRAIHYEKNTSLTGAGDCAGCAWHMHNGRMFPPDKPCSQLGMCVVLANIKPERIIAKLDLLKP